ncbi:MAG TPA: adenylate/guanylate cyclase domain-containing protein [Casimicrobiaceae bacterium]
MARDQRRLAAIVSADVAGYSRLMGHDEGRTLAALKAHRRELIDPKIAEYGGRIVKTTGDGLLLEFPSVVDAVRCSVDVQRAMAERNASVAADERIDFRIGINVGDIIIDGDDIFGDGVNVAARLQGLADRGGICVSRVVRDQVLDKLSFAFDDLGPKEVKNIERPVEVFRVAFDTPPGVAAAPSTSLKPQRADSRRLAFAAAGLLGVAAAASIAFFVWQQPAKITPYSAQDRRMTVAVLPFTAPTGDEGAAKVAAATTEAVTAVWEAKTIFVVIAPRASVAQAIAKYAATKDIAKALDVHFLLRGNISRGAAGYNAELLVLDGETERVLGTGAIAIPAGQLEPRSREEIRSMLGPLTFKALQVEVQRARSKSDEALDVRDLAFRAYVDWNEGGEAGYRAAMGSLKRALALDPNDNLALSATAEINLCDCIRGWSKDYTEQQAIGADALEKYLQRNPDSERGLGLKADLLGVQGQYEQQLTVADELLRREPDSAVGLAEKANALLKLSRPREALPVAERLLASWDQPVSHALVAAVHYALGENDLAVRDALQATARMSREDLSNRWSGTVLLTLVAAEARRGQRARADKALADFRSAVPGVTTIGEIKAWMRPTAPLAGYEPLYDGLRMAGVREQ